MTSPSALQICFGSGNLILVKPHRIVYTLGCRAEVMMSPYRAQELPFVTCKDSTNQVTHTSHVRCNIKKEIVNTFCSIRILRSLSIVQQNGQR